LPVHLGSGGCFLGGRAIGQDQMIAMGCGLGDAGTAIGHGERVLVLGLGRVLLAERDRVLLKPAMLGRGRRLCRQRSQLGVGRLTRACTRFEPRRSLRHRRRGTSRERPVVRRKLTQDGGGFGIERREALQCALMPLPILRFGLPPEACAIAVCRAASAA
jgi:hypothetical protein